MAGLRTFQSRESTWSAAPIIYAILLAVFSVSPSFAQGRGGGPGGGPGGGGPGGPGGGMSRNPFGGGGSVPGSHGSQPPGTGPNGGGGPADSTMRGGLQLGPPGRWWDDQRFAESIGLASNQQRRMDDLFSANKGTLIKLYKNLQHEESQLGRLVRGKELVESQIFEQIDRVAQARGELEKANAHMLLEIRKEMTPDQAARLDDHRPSSP